MNNFRLKIIIVLLFLLVSTGVQASNLPEPLVSIGVQASNLPEPLVSIGVQASDLPEPYVFNLYFSVFSLTPEMDYLMRLDEIKDAIIEKKPVKIEIQVYLDNKEDKSLGVKRAEYVQRWLKSEKINAVYSISVFEDSKPTPCDYLKEDDPAKRRVKIIVYDQRIIFAIQDAKRSAIKKTLKKPLAHTSDNVPDFGSFLEGTPVNYEFKIRNLGDATLEILKVKPD